MKTRPLLILAALLSAAATGGCKDNSEKKEPAGSGAPEEAEDQATNEAKKAEALGELGRRGKGEHRGRKGKFKEPGVYLDGEPIAFIKFAELPLTLEVDWVEGEVDVEYSGGEEAPEPEKTRYRRYLLADYLEALGVDLERIEEVHIYGGFFAGSIAGRELREARDRIRFSFGRVTHGKTLFHPPNDIDIGTSFDSIAAVALYADKEPPEILDTAEVEFQGEVTTDIPYYGEPLRGGIRVYKDDRLATVIKRRLLKNEEELGYWEGEELRWNLGPFLEAQEVELGDVVAAELIYNDRRVQRIDGDEVRGTYFVATPQKRGEILLGDDKRAVEAITLYTEKLPPIDPDDIRYEIGKEGEEKE